MLASATILLFGFFALGHAGDQLVSGPVECTNAVCSGYTVEFLPNSNISWDCNELSACEDTTFIVNPGCHLVGRLHCSNDYSSRGCYNAKIVVNNSDLDPGSYHLDCKDSGDGVFDACAFLSLSLFDSFLDATCDEDNCANFHAHLYGTSRFELRPGATLSSSNLMEVYLYGRDAEFIDGGASPYTLYRIVDSTTSTTMSATTTTKKSTTTTSIMTTTIISSETPTTTKSITTTTIISSQKPTNSTTTGGFETSDSDDDNGNSKNASTNWTILYAVIGGVMAMAVPFCCGILFYWMKAKKKKVSETNPMILMPEEKRTVLGAPPPRKQIQPGLVPEIEETEVDDEAVDEANHETRDKVVCDSDIRPMAPSMSVGTMLVLSQPEGEHGIVEDPTTGKGPDAAAHDDEDVCWNVLTPGSDLDIVEDCDKDVVVNDQAEGKARL